MKILSMLLFYIMTTCWSIEYARLATWPLWLQYPLFHHAGIAILGEDEVVQQGYAKYLSGIPDSAGNFFVLPGWFKASGWMVVGDQDG